jgi:hypothetical protein
VCFYSEKASLAHPKVKRQSTIFKSRLQIPIGKYIFALPFKKAL